MASHRNPIKPILRNEFYHDGRGPELIKVHYSANGSSIIVLDYYNPDVAYNEKYLRHLKFIKPQVFMFTPEEVQNYSARGNDWGNYDNTEILCLEKSDWLTSFKERHLQNCKHYRVMFYDEFLDIICEGI
ncbi:MAG: hypothetical protein GWN00_32180, partial [Aliifodinibius sp.]|nr:hypothetical protein [Fodinibius sp.]NIY29278.1 hypothetical protein [Fodinibius sp.]